MGNLFRGNEIKDFILFFDEMSRFVPEADKIVIDELIRQEKERIAKRR